MILKMALIGLMGISAANAQSVQCVGVKQNYSVNYLLTKTNGTDRLVAVRFTDQNGRSGSVEVNFGNDVEGRNQALRLCNEKVTSRNICTHQTFQEEQTLQGGHDAFGALPDVKLEARLEVLTSNGLAAPSETECRAIEGSLVAEQLLAEREYKREEAAKERVRENSALAQKAHRMRVGSDH